MNGGPLPAPGSVTVSVLDGTGSYNQATEASAALGQLGFDVVGTGHTSTVGTPSETVVTCSQRTPADEAAAQAVAASISAAVAWAYGPTTDGAGVTVTTGSDFAIAPPAPPVGPTATPTSLVASSTSSTSSTVRATATGFGAPTTPVEPLAAWGPRSCTPTGGEGP